jgi:hypothetical protein
VPDQPHVSLGRLTEADRYFDQTKQIVKLTAAGRPKTRKQRSKNQQKVKSLHKHKTATSCICSHPSMHAPSQNQARHREKPRRRTMEKRYETITSSIYQAASAVHYHHGKRCRKRRMERNNEHPVTGKSD